MAMVPKITTVATATVTLLASALTTGSVASTAAAPQMLLPAPISQLVCLSRPNTFCREAGDEKGAGQRQNVNQNTADADVGNLGERQAKAV
jgi:hypothetical protein